MRIRPVLVAVALAAMSSIVPAYAATGPTHPAQPAKKKAPIVYRVPAGWPKTFAIPRFSVKAVVESLKFSSIADGKAPKQWGDVAWYDRGPRPGDRGRATIFGHLDSTCCPAVFWQLHSLRPGDVVQVNYKTGNPLRFRVMWQGTYANAHLPLKFMFGNSNQRGLTLMTCAGIFHTDGTGYDHKLLVYTRLILPSGKLG